MNLYKKCMLFSDEFKNINFDKNNQDLQIYENTKNISFPDDLSVEFNPYNNFAFSEIHYISDVHLTNKIIDRFRKGTRNFQVKKYIKQVAQSIFSEELSNTIKENGSPIVFFGGDISESFEISRIFYKEFIKQWDQLQKFAKYRCRKRIFAVLGNHEFWEFKNIDDCYEKYGKLFNSLGIHFLNNNKTLIGNVMLAGGTGFAGYNTEFNAKRGIYRSTLTREREIEETNKWLDVYHNTLQEATENNFLIILLTHNPIADWKPDKIPDRNCIYFNGHTHRNEMVCNEEKNCFIFANNQVGYYNSKIKLAVTYVFNRINPFATYKDGFYNIKSAEYIKFYYYFGENIKGNGQVEKIVKKDDAGFYMIKHNNFYGFFLISSKASYVCAGGRIKKTKKYRTIDEFDKDFLVMVSQYLKIMSPYRRIQEEISRHVKSLGGSGKIHGSIVDIDFYNHIMINPIDGKITYYYSPVYGEIETFKTLKALLEKHNKEMVEQYIKYYDSSVKLITPDNEYDELSEIIKIDIKNSVYTYSNKINQIQRLFEKKILRDWNDDLLSQGRQESDFDSIDNIYLTSCLPNQ